MNQNAGTLETSRGGILTLTGQQWLIVTCWMGLIVWVGYNTNMTIYADIRYSYVTWPVWGWWLYDIWFITPFLALPYLHTVNREIFSD